MPPLTQQQAYDLWLQQQQQQNPQAGNGWINNQNPDGSLQGAQVTSSVQQPPKVSTGEQVAGAGAQIAGYGLGASGAQQLTGMLGSAPAAAAPSAVNASVAAAAPSAPNVVGASIAGSAPSAPSIVGTNLSSGGSGALGMTGASPLLGAAGVAAGTAVGLEQGAGVAHAAQNKPMDWKEEAALALPTFGLSYAYNPVRDFFGSKKDSAQLKRDAVRKILKEREFINDKYQIEFGDGSFDIGKDGGEPWYNVDFSDPNIGGVVAAVQPLAAFFAGGDKKLTNDFAGYFTNAAKGGKDPMERVQEMYGKTKMGHDQIYGAIHLMAQPGPHGEKPVLDNATADAYKNGLDQLYGVGAYEGQGPKFGTPPPQAQLAQQVKPASVPPRPPPSGVQNPTQKSSPFIGSPNYKPAGGIVGRTRISPGVYSDAKGQYLSKTGDRGK